MTTMTTMGEKKKEEASKKDTNERERERVRQKKERETGRSQVRQSKRALLKPQRC